MPLLLRVFLITEFLLTEEYLVITKKTSGREQSRSFTIAEIAYNRVYGKRGVLYSGCQLTQFTLVKFSLHRPIKLHIKLKKVIKNKMLRSVSKMSNSYP